MPQEYKGFSNEVKTYVTERLDFPTGPSISPIFFFVFQPFSVDEGFVMKMRD